jgi:hypothetical protein
MRVRCAKPECYPKRSDLTQSPFYGTLYGIQETLEDAVSDWRGGDGDLSDLSQALRDAAEELRNLGEEAQSSLDNMPEGLQQGDTGQLLETRVEECESKADELESAADEIDGLELIDADDDSAVESHAEENNLVKAEDESDDQFKERVQESIKEANESVRDEAVQTAEGVDMDIE